MRKSLFWLLGLIGFWSLFYAGFKYFFWGSYESVSFAPTLESISWYVLIGSMIAYVVWGALYAKLSEKFMLFSALVLGSLFFLVWGFLPYVHPVFFPISMIGLGFSYSLYVIGKNNLIGREIATSKLGSSTIGACTTIIFIVFLIVGTIVGAKFWENQSIHTIGIFYFLVLLIIAAIALLFTTAAKSKTSFTFSLPLYKKLFLRYGIFMIGLGCFWQISVEASQVAINYSKEFFDKSNSAASFLLLFSSLGAIIGNIVSVKIAQHRMRSFLVLAILFSITIFSFSSILSLVLKLDQYAIVQALAFTVGLFFWGAVNLAESYFFSLLGNDSDKDYTSALYGFTLSVVGAITMFLSEKILHSGSYTGISLFLGFLTLIAIFGGWKGIKIR